MSAPCSGLAMVTKGRNTSSDMMAETSNIALQHQHIVRCFMHKLAQVVVQSRYGTTTNSQERTPDWVTTYVSY